MNYKKSISCVILTFFTMAFCWNGRADEKSPPSSIHAVRVVRLNSPDSETIAGFWKWSSQVPADFLDRMTSMASDTLEIPAADIKNIWSVTFDSNIPQLTIAIDLRHAPAGTKMLAGVVADRVLDEFRRLINPSQYASQIEQLEQMEGELEAQQARLRDEISQEEASLRKSTGSIDVSPTTIRQLLFSLQTQRETVQIDLAAKQARRDALAEQIAKSSAEMEQKVKEDPVAAELEKVVEFCQKNLEHKQQMVKSGVATVGEIDEAMGPLAEAKAKLLERHEAAAAAAGGEMIAEWNKEMMILSVDLAELKARSKVIEERLNQFSSAGDYIDRSEELQNNLAELTKQLADVKKQRSEATAAFAYHQVSYTVVKSTDDPAPTTAPSR
jgi:hypothetical protein